MRPTARKLLATLVQEAFSYELSLNRPVDPHSGTNATIEQNPQAVKDLIEVPEGRRLLDEAYSKMSVYAKYEFLTEVGYHGLSNSSAIGGGLLTAMEELNLNPAGPNVNFETLLSTNEDVARAWATGAIKCGLSDTEYENAVIALNKQYLSYLDLTGDFNRSTFELYLGWGKLYSADPFKALVDEWPHLDREERRARLDVIKTGVEDRLSCIEDATPIWRAEIPIDQLEDSFTARHGTIIDVLNEYQYSSPFIEFFTESSEALVAILKEHGYDVNVVETFEGYAKRFKELSGRLFTRDYLGDAKLFQEGGRALLRAHLLKRFGSVQVSQEGLDDIYQMLHGAPPVQRHTALPLKQQRIDGIIEELDTIFAAALNLDLDDKERALVEDIYQTETFGKNLLSGKWDYLKEISASHYNAVVTSFKHHQTENGIFYDLLKQYVENKGKDLERTHRLLDWIDGAMASNDTATKAVEQFDSGHAEYEAPCFELCRKASERASAFPEYDVVCGTKISKLKPSDEATALKFELLSEEQRDNADALCGRFLGARSLAKIEEWLGTEINAVGRMGTYDAMNRNAGGEGVGRELARYSRFLIGAREHIAIHKYVFASLACSVRNLARSRIHLIDIIFKARAGVFTMEGLEEELGVQELLTEGAKYSEEGIVDFLKKIFKIKKTRPTSDSLYLEELEKECKSWKNPAAKAIAIGGVREVPEELLATLKKIAGEEYSPSMWRTAKLKRFFQFTCECNKIEDLGSTLYEELCQANSTDEILAIVDKMRNNIKAFLELCNRYGIDKKKRPEFTPVPDIELYRDVTSNMNASMAMLERGWSSREGGSWLIFETKYYGWFAAALEDGESNSLIEQIDEDKLLEIQTEIDELVDELRHHFNWVHHPIHDIEAYITRARLAVLKYGEQIEEGKLKNVAMEELDDQEVVRLLSEGVQVSQEGFLDLVRKLFSKKPEKPDKKLERLEKECLTWKNQEAKALVTGTASNLPEVLEKRLAELSKKDFAPCQWLSKELKPFLDFYTEAANTLVDYDQGFHDELEGAKDRKTVEDVLKRARENINSHIALAKKHKMSLSREPTYVEMPTHELYLDLTKRFADSVKLAEKSHGKTGYFLVYTTQYYGWFFGTLEDLNSVGFEDFSEEETDKIRDEFSLLDDEFSNLFDWGCAPDDDIRNFLKKGRLLLLEAGDAIEHGKEITLSMEGFMSDLFDRLTGKKKTPVKTTNVETYNEAERPDKLGFGWDDGYELAEEFVEQTKGRGGDYNIETLSGEKFRIPVSILSTPVANRNKILSWFETNSPETKDRVEAFYTVFEERTMAPDTAVLPVWYSTKHQRLVRLWSQVSKEISKYPVKDPSQADFKNIVHFWSHNGFAELAKAELGIENLSEYRYGDLLDDLFDSRVKLTSLDYEKAATGRNPLYAQIGTFNTYRWWATANVIGVDNFAASALFGKLEDKYMSVEYEWQVVLANLMVLSWHIGNLSGKKA